jgi:hypothetical protein
MTFTPTLYVDRYDGRYWLFFQTPSGAIVRLFTSYPDQKAACIAGEMLGFKLVPKPTTRPTITLNKPNTTPR